MKKTLSVSALFAVFICLGLASCLKTKAPVCVCPEPELSMLRLGVFYTTGIILPSDSVYIVRYKENNFTGKRDSVLFEKGALKQEGNTYAVFYADTSKSKSVVIRSPKIGLNVKINNIVLEDIQVGVPCCDKVEYLPGKKFISYSLNGVTETTLPVYIEKK